VNIRHFKKSLVAFNIVLTGLILYLGTIIFREWKSENRPGRAPDHAVSQKSRTPAGTPGQEARPAAYQAIVGRDIFSTTPSPVSMAARLEEETIAPTQLKLRLNGTVVGGRYAYAVILDAQTNKEGIYTVNDTVQSATIAHIQADRVVLNVSGRKEALILFPEEKDADAKSSGSGYQAAPVKRPFAPRHVPDIRRPASRLPSK